MRAAAENLVPVTLELGGKSPTIISRTADFKDAVSQDHHRQAAQRRPDLPGTGLCVRARRATGRLRRGGPEVVATSCSRRCWTTPTTPRSSTPGTSSACTATCSEAREAGVELIELNPADEDFSDQPHHKIVPTLLRNPGDELQVMQDEIFGPLLPFKPYNSFAEVVSLHQLAPASAGPVLLRQRRRRRVLRAQPHRLPVA